MSSVAGLGLIYGKLAPACLGVDNFVSSLKVGAFSLTVREIEDGARFAAGAGWGKGVVEQWFEHNELIKFNLANVGVVSSLFWGKPAFEFLNKWCVSRGWDEVSNYGVPYVNNNWFLWSVWKRFLEPRSEYPVGAVYFDDTSSNPIRISSGEEWSAIHPVVGVAVRELIKLADEVFPPRSPEWLSVFASLATFDTDAEVGYKIICQVASSFEKVKGAVGADVWEVFIGLLCSREGEAGYGSFLDVAAATAGALEV